MAKVIVVTGASRGIGLAVSRFLLQKKCKIVVVARSAQPLRDLSTEFPGNVIVVSRDLSDWSKGHEIIQLAIDTWGRLDGLVVNHGTLNPVSRVADATAEEWRKLFDINFFSAISLVRAAIPELRKVKGRIIFTSSGAAINAYAAWGAYGASKAALNHFTTTLMTEERLITSISIRPGTVDTDMQRDIRELHKEAMDPKDVEKFSNLKSQGLLLKPEIPGNVVGKLVLEAPRELSGRFLQWACDSSPTIQRLMCS